MVTHRSSGVGADWVEHVVRVLSPTGVVDSAATLYPKISNRIRFARAGAKIWAFAQGLNGYVLAHWFLGSAWHDGFEIAEDKRVFSASGANDGSLVLGLETDPLKCCETYVSAFVYR